MSIIETMGATLAEAYGPDVEFGDMARAALRAIKPEDVSEKMRTVLRWELDNTLNLHGYEDDEIDQLLARAIAAAIAAGAEQPTGGER